MQRDSNDLSSRGIDEDKFWQQLANELVYQPKQPGEITVNEFAELIGASVSSAYATLEKMVKEGKLIKRSMRGKPAYYRRADNNG